jgi:hypothetical protein
VDTAKQTEATLKLTADFGTLNLTVEGNPALGGNSDHALCRVRFFDAMEEEVLPGDPWVAFGTVNRSYSVTGIPSGTYRIEVTGYGLQPVTHPHVEITRGADTELSVTPSAAAILKLTLNGIDAAAMVQGGAKCDYLDAAGKPVDIRAPGHHLFNLAPSRDTGKTGAWLLNLTPAVAKVVIQIKGYEDIEVKVTAEPGKTILATVTAKKKQD